LTLHADLRPRLRFRAVVRLSPQELSHSRKPGRDRRLSSCCAHGGAEPASVRAAADCLRDGDREHALRRALSRERPALRHQRSVCEPAVALVPHRSDEFVADRRPAGTETVTGRPPPWPAADRGDPAPADRVRHLVSGPRRETVRRPSRTQARGTQPDRRCSHPLALDRRTVSLSLFVQSRVPYAALLPHDRHPAVLPELYRRPRRDLVGWLDLRRADL